MKEQDKWDLRVCGSILSEHSDLNQGKVMIFLTHLTVLVYLRFVAGHDNRSLKGDSGMNLEELFKHIKDEHEQDVVEDSAYFDCAGIHESFDEGDTLQRFRDCFREDIE